MEEFSSKRTSFEDIINKPKRARASNFTSQEEDILTSLVEKYAGVLENKKTNAVTWQEKNEVWDTIADEFGSQSNAMRSGKHLREKYENMKRKTKVAVSVHRNQLYKTGGGSYKREISNNEERIVSLLGKSATGLQNNCDSDMCDQNNSVIDVDFLEEEFLVEPIPEVTVIEEKQNSWSKWNPAKLKAQKSEKLKSKKLTLPAETDEVLNHQKIFFENEDRRAEERHIMLINKHKLEEELLELQIALKKLEIKKLE